MTPPADYTVAIDKAQDGSFATAGDDISTDVDIDRRLSIRRGHSSGRILSPIAAGQCRCFVDNDGGDYDPDGSVRAGLPIRVTAVNGLNTYNLFTGILDEPKPRPGLRERRAELKALGTMSRLVGRRVSTALYENITTDVAIGHVLDGVGWPAGDRSLETGQTTLDFWWLDEQDAFTAIRDLINTEGPGASAHEDGLGRFVFHNRQHILTAAASKTPQSTFNQLATPYYAQPFDHNKTRRNVINAAAVSVKTRSAKTTAVIWTGPASITLGVNESRSYRASSGDGNPFKTALTPVANTDYTVTAGSLSLVTLERSSGANALITLTAGASGATVTGLQLRADPVTVDSETVVENTLDTSQSQTDYDGVYAMPESFAPRAEISIDTAQSLVNAVCAFHRDPRAILSFAIPDPDTTSLEAGLGAEINDRIRLLNSELNLDVEAWVLEIEHQVRAGRVHRTILRCEEAAAGNEFGIWGSGIWGTSVWGF